MPPRKPRFITRNVPSKCVLARIRRCNKLYEQYFYLTEYSSWEAAERAAKTWVKEILPTLPDPLPIKDRMTKRNNSGIVGVQLAKRTIRKGGGTNGSDSWKACWPECPNRGGVSWATEKYGDDGAFVRAALARELESVDRELIEQEFEKLIGTKKIRSILAKKNSSNA